ncbi:MAG: EF-P lysine aminoacylase GenX [Geminicoccaceae bacterium]|nr:EF-P lysine aminoacylase GenX [Geminicoccaceae bacterium]
MQSSTPFWHAESHADRRPFLLDRQRILQGVRDYFAFEGFLETETPILQVSPGNETHLHAFSSEYRDVAGENPRKLYLHTSPEFAMKKLLAAGETRIFNIARCFRNREAGPLHHPEFTMLEWYRAGESVDALMRDCEELLTRAAAATGRDRLLARGREIPLERPFERLSVSAAFRQFADIDLMAALDEEAMREAAARAGIRTAADDTWSDMFSRVVVERIEPKLGHSRPTFLCDYPAAEAALARRRTDDPRLAERFELYAGGIELANGFAELTDAREQRERFIDAMNEKERIYGERYPIDDGFIEALAHMPDACGIALGLDRLVMLTTGARHIQQVIWAPTAYD